MKTKLLIALVVSSIVITSCTTTERSKENEFESAVRMSDIPKIDKLLKEGMNIDSKIINDKTALIIASESGDDLVVKELISRGASLEIINRHGLTALFFAVDNDNISTARILISSGAKMDVFYKGVNGNDYESPLMSAADKPLVEMVKLLVESKADVNLQNSDGDTALDFAEKAIPSEKDRIKVSFDEGKVPESEKKISEERLKGYSEIIKYLREHGGKTKAELPPAPDEKK